MADEQQGFAKDYSERGFWEKVRGFARAAGEGVLEPALKLFYASQDGETPAWAKAVIYSALGYFISPVDAIPDMTPIVGYADDPDGAEIELTYNYGVDRYDLGSAFGHVAVEVPDAAAACEAVRGKGGKVTREAGPVKGGTTVIAFVEDPDGYKIELIERKR